MGQKAVCLIESPHRAGLLYGTDEAIVLSRLLTKDSSMFVTYDATAPVICERLHRPDHVIPLSNESILYFFGSAKEQKRLLPLFSGLVVADSNMGVVPRAAQDARRPFSAATSAPKTVSRLPGTFQGSRQSWHHSAEALPSTSTSTISSLSVTFHTKQIQSTSHATGARPSKTPSNFQLPVYLYQQ